MGLHHDETLDDWIWSKRETFFLQKSQLGGSTRLRLHMGFVVQCVALCLYILASLGESDGRGVHVHAYVEDQSGAVADGGVT